MCDTFFLSPRNSADFDGLWFDLLFCLDISLSASFLFLFIISLFRKNRKVDNEI